MRVCRSAKRPFPIGDLNSYALAGTATSRLRVCRSANREYAISVAKEGQLLQRAGHGGETGDGTQGSGPALLCYDLSRKGWHYSMPSPREVQEVYRGFPRENCRRGGAD